MILFRLLLPIFIVSLIAEEALKCNFNKTYPNQIGLVVIVHHGTRPLRVQQFVDKSLLVVTPSLTVSSGGTSAFLTGVTRFITFELLHVSVFGNLDTSERK